jgi:hypothetical protein
MKLRELIGLTKDWHTGTKQEKDRPLVFIGGHLWPFNPIIVRFKR